MSRWYIVFRADIELEVDNEPYDSLYGAKVALREAVQSYLHTTPTPVRVHEVTAWERERESTPPLLRKRPR